MNATETRDTPSVRPRYTLAGIDSTGAHHIYRTIDETVFVIQNGTRTHRIELASRSIDDWLDHADKTRGLRDRNIWRTFGEMLTDRVEVEAE